MPRTPLEREILSLLREDPLRGADSIADLLGRPVEQVQSALVALSASGELRGFGWVLAPRRSVVVVGGANMDSKARSDGPTVLRTSNPGGATWTPGGVGRNIAENLARLGTAVELVAAVGADDVGAELLARTKEAGVGVDAVVTTKASTGVYIAVLDDAGELVVAVSDMTATDAITVPHLTACRDLLAAAEMIVLDGNIPALVCTWLLEFAAAAQIPVVVDPVSVPKALHFPRSISPERPVLAITPNLDELAVLASADLRDDVSDIAAAALDVHSLGVTHVWVRRGARGSLLSSLDEAAHQQVLVLEAGATDVVDVTGGGDAMTAGFVHELLKHGDAVRAARFGQASACLAVESTETVRSDLTPALVDARAAHLPDAEPFGIDAPRHARLTLPSVPLP